jgi:hypothetical protein
VPRGIIFALLALLTTAAMFCLTRQLRVCALSPQAGFSGSKPGLTETLEIGGIAETEIKPTIILTRTMAPPGAQKKGKSLRI